MLIAFQIILLMLMLTLANGVVKETEQYKLDRNMGALIAVFTVMVVTFLI